MKTDHMGSKNTLFKYEPLSSGFSSFLVLEPEAVMAVFEKIFFAVTPKGGLGSPFPFSR